MIGYVSELIYELDYYELANSILKGQMTDVERDLEKCEAENANLKQKIRILEGQIEAYQYCMNCKR